MTTADRADARDLLAPLAGATAPVGRLRAALADRADRDGLLDVAYRTVDTPVGTLLLAATTRGLVRVAYAERDQDAIVARLGEQLGPRVMAAPRRLEAATRQLDEYFAGARRAFELPLDWQLAQGFRRAVLTRVAAIAYGATASYGELATAVGAPGAARAVGTACARNPLPVVVPCHRVVRSDGSVGHYAGGAEAKVALLALEGAGGRGERGNAGAPR